MACAVGNAVLDIIENENLQEHALELGNYLMEQLKELQPKHKFMGEVRGMGLFIGVELVKDLTTKEPATEEAKAVVNKAKEKFVLISADGPDSNVIKIKPPMCFAKDDADLLVSVFHQALNEVEQEC